jgi:uncharacterized protein
VKLSQFTVLVPDFPSKGRNLVCNTFNQAIAIIGDQAKSVLNNLHGPVQDDEQKYVRMFTELGFVVDDSVDESREFKEWYSKARYDKSVMRATILTTYNCNFACEYCVEEGVKGSARMDEELCQATVDWLLDRAGKHRPDTIQLLFYGGEPLMNVTPIDRIASRINDYSKNNDVSFSFTITTNGSLLKPDLVDRLEPLGLKSIKVTLDGDRDAHNSKRPFRNGKGSFDVIIKNILQVIDKTRIRVSANVDSENLESIPRMLDYLEEIGIKEKIESIRFNPIVHIQGQENTSELVRQAECATVPEEWVMYNLIKLTWDALMRGFKTEDSLQLTACSMNLDGTAVVIDPLGRIYTCPAFVGREGFQAGDIYHQDLFDKHREFMSMELPDKCFECAYMPLCGGGCKHVAYIKHGDLSRTMCDQDYLQRATAEALKMHVITQSREPRS